MKAERGKRLGSRDYFEVEPEGKISRSGAGSGPAGRHWSGEREIISKPRGPGVSVPFR